MNDTIYPPRRFRKIIDVVCDADRKFFLAHPGMESYTRPFIPGEIWPEPGDFDAVVVTEIEPGVRVRQPIKMLRPPNSAGPELDH